MAKRCVSNHRLRTKAVRFEIPGDPDCCRAKDDDVFPVEDDGDHTFGRARAWHLDDREESLVLVLWGDGELMASLQRYEAEED
jgi:hypothetical protein